MSVKHFGLHSSEEGFNNAVILTITFPGHRLDNTSVLQHIHICMVLVLPPHIGMEDQAVSFWELRKGFIKHVCHLLQVWTSGQIVGDDLIRCHVQYRRQITFAPWEGEL